MPKLLKSIEVYQCELCCREYTGNGAKEQATQCEQQGIRLPLYPKGTKVRFRGDKKIYIITCALLDKDEDAPDCSEAHAKIVYCIAPKYEKYSFDVVDEESVEPIDTIQSFPKKPKRVKNWEAYYEWDKKMFGDIPYPKDEIDKLKASKGLTSAQQ